MLDGMVGAPKHLSDLARIEADVRFTCRYCGFEWDVDREALTRRLLREGRSTVWSEITRDMPCRRPRCSARNTRATPIPFSHRPPNQPVPMRALDRKALDAALSILTEAAKRSTSEVVASIPVRLALLVVQRFLRDADLVGDYWRAASKRYTDGDSCHLPLRHIRNRLIRQGYLEGQPE